MKKQSKDYSLLRFLGLAFLRKEFLKSRAGLQDDRPEVSRSSTNPALLPLRSTQRGEGTGVSLGIQGRCSWKCLFAFYHAFRENFREHLIAPELKRNDSFFIFFASWRYETAVLFTGGEFTSALLSSSTARDSFIYSDAVKHLWGCTSTGIHRKR